jgi:hypothetical protein
MSLMLQRGGQTDEVFLIGVTQEFQGAWKGEKAIFWQSRINQSFRQRFMSLMLEPMMSPNSLNWEQGATYLNYLSSGSGIILKRRYEQLHVRYEVVGSKLETERALYYVKK